MLLEDFLLSLTAETVASPETAITILEIPDSLERREWYNRTYSVAKQFNSVRLFASTYRDTEREYRRAEALHGSSDDLYSRPYIDHNGSKYIVIPQALSEYMRKYTRYIFVKSGVKSSVQRYIYRGGVYVHISDDEFKGEIKKLIPQELHSTRVVNEVFGQLITDNDRFKAVDELNDDEHIINFQNGILHLDTMKMLEHSPDILSTIQIPCNFNPDMDIPDDLQFTRYLNHLCEGEQARMQTILEFMGVSLSNVCGYQFKKALFLVGVGDTGKSQCRELIIRMIGEKNTCAADLSEIEERFGTSSLYGKRLAGSSDMGFMALDDLRVFKQLTGGDTIQAEFKGENPINFKYRGALWFCANAMPRFGGDKGQWVYDRMLIIPCNNPVPHKDPFLLEKMYAERECIAFLCVQALRDMMKRGGGYTISGCSRKALTAYQRENDPIAQFLEECTMPRPGGKVQDDCTKSRFHAVYRAWASENGHGRISSQTLGKAFNKTGIELPKIHGEFYYPDITLTIEAKKRYRAAYGIDTISNI